MQNAVQYGDIRQAEISVGENLNMGKKGTDSRAPFRKKTALRAEGVQ